MGTDIISTSADASNGSYLAWLCKPECTITFKTDNSDTPASGLFAVAPTIDYIKLTADAKLSWEPVEDNIN